MVEEEEEEEGKYFYLFRKSVYLMHTSGLYGLILTYVSALSAYSRHPNKFCIVQNLGLSDIIPEKISNEFQLVLTHTLDSSQIVWF